MAMVVAHNVPSLNAQKNLYKANSAFNSSLSKLSSGYRINKGSDGPADLVISEKLRSQTNGLERAVRNTSESNNVLSIAEGALNEMNSILKKMKSLAIHASNSGVTSPDQVASDQAEMDSGIQTLERIANTTKYSDQYLLNGSKDLTYNVNTTTTGTQNNRLINTDTSNFQQIFKRDGYQVSISFNGATEVDNTTGLGNAAMQRQATKAYLEVDTHDTTISQVDTNGHLTKGQSFILTGTLGSRQFNFSEGAHISEIVSSIHNVAGSTGVDASLTFNRNQTINQSDTGVKGLTDVGLTDAAATKANITIYDNYKTVDGTKELIAKAADVSGEIVYGKNTDGQGNVYVKVGQNDTFEVYKDASMSKESLIATGVTATDGATTDSVSRNNSGLKIGIELAANAAYGDVFKLSLGNIALDACSITATGAGATMYKDVGDDQDAGTGSTASGVQLGINTSTDGKIFIKTVFNSDGSKANVYAYNNSLMRDQDMVAKTANAVDVSGAGVMVLDSIWNDEHTANTGLGLTLKFEDISASADDKANTSETMEMQFSNLGARIYSNDYGSNSFIKVQQMEGGLFVDYEDQANYDSAKLIEKGTTFQKNGQDATVNVNGKQMKTNGLQLNLATQDIQANISFNSGKSGTTTIAQVGYGEGSVFTKNTSLTLSFGVDSATGKAVDDPGSNGAGSTNKFNTHFTGLLNNAGHNTTETVGNFQGGMQLQLGEGAGDQERTVLGLKSMSTSQLGRVQVTGQFDKSKAVTETRTLSIQDVMGGQVASLSASPTNAMKIIDKAIEDVSNVRAQIGAVQANMLETNENNLRVAIENITKTESGIRDTDMASEMTEFTKNQVLSSAGMSMLAQANQQSQSVMQLIG